MSLLRVDHLILKNFRCFDSLSIAFEPDTTVLFAENGAGKSAVLTADLKTTAVPIECARNCEDRTEVCDDSSLRIDLNLNHSQLKTARREWLAVEERQKVSRFVRAPLPPEAGEAEAVKLESQNPYRPFVSLRVAFWRGEIGKHR